MYSSGTRAQREKRRRLQQAAEQVRPAGGGFGMAINGAPHPGVINKGLRPAKFEELKVEELGEGHSLVDVDYNETDKRLTFRRGSIQEEDGIRYGFVEGGASSGPIVTVVDVPEADDWENDYLDPSTFTHGDALPAGLVDGLGYVRLHQGSAPISPFAWNADVDAADIGDSTLAHTDDSVRPRVIFARYDSTNGWLNVFFNQPIKLVNEDILPSDAAQIRSTFLGNIPISGFVASAQANVLVLLCDSVPDFVNNERWYVRLSEGIVSNYINAGLTNLSSSFYDVVGDLDAYCYVPVINRSEQDLSPGDPVIIGSPVEVWDTNNLYRLAYEVFPLGKTQPVYVLRIIGGNTLDDGSTDGIKSLAAQLADIPAAYDPNVDVAYPDGIGRATLYIDNVEQPDKVLVINDGRFPSTPVDFALFVEDRTEGYLFSIPIVGGGSMMAYAPGLLQ